MSIVTDSMGLDDKKDPSKSAIVTFYKFFATPNEVAEMEDKYRAGGYGYGHAKMALLDKMHDFFGPARKRFDELMKNPGDVENILNAGKEKARHEAARVLTRARKACGLE
jgi:tryptophanyl-tRNA synthetase